MLMRRDGHIPSKPNMTEDTHIVAICGSLRDTSTTLMALEHALTAAADAGASTRLIDLRAYDLPAYDPDAPDAGDSHALRTAVRSADGILLGTPMYHGTLSSGLKTALDYLSRRDFNGVTIGLLVTAGGSFPRPLLAHMRSVGRALNAWTFPHQVAIPNAGDQFEDGIIQDDSLGDRIEDLGRDIVRYAGVSQ